MKKPALLALANGTVLRGNAIGSLGVTTAELIFNTSMTGYQEILTDPSYAGQSILFTYPHIGNVGFNFEDNESKRIWCASVIMREPPRPPSNFRSKGDLEALLQQHNIVGITEIDTRYLTHLLREKGAQAACLMSGEIDETFAIETARQYKGIGAHDWVTQVSTPCPYTWQERTYAFRYYKNYRETLEKAYPTVRKVVVFDYGVKQNILRLLADRNLEITVVPAKTSFADVMQLRPQGIVFSNGPGDPLNCDYAVSTIQQCLQEKIPLLGICLGIQLFALALGGKTKKMSLGHHGANHPVQCLRTGKVFITSQNHGFCVDEESLPETCEITHRSLFDGTIQGLAHKKLNAFAFQGHPEANPGPQDIECLFDEFCKNL